MSGSANPKPRGALLAAIVIVAVATVWWCLRGEGAPQKGSPKAAALRADAKPEIAESPPTTPGATSREAATIDDPSAAAAGLQLRVRLRGLHPQAPWTQELALAVEGVAATTNTRVEALLSAHPDASGRATFSLPAWYRTATSQSGFLAAEAEGFFARDDHRYRSLLEHWHGTLDLEQELVFDVHAVAALHGCVLDDGGTPVPAARITAFAWREGEPVGRSVGRTNSDRDGTFRLDTAPETPLLLVVTAMREVPRGMMIAFGPGQIADFGELRADLLPTTLPARAVVGESRNVGTVVLPRGAPIVGTVRWSDGAPIARATVRSLPREGVVLSTDEGAAVVRALDGRVTAVGTVETADDGTFALPGGHWVTTELAVEGTSAVRVAGVVQATARPPEPTVITLPRPVRLRATDGSRTFAKATIEVMDWETVSTDEQGESALVAARPLRVRAASGRLRSPWIDVPTTAADHAVELRMTDARVPVTIDFEGADPVRNLLITWRRSDGEQGSEPLQREDDQAAVELFLEPGRYHLTAAGDHLLPVARDVEVTGPTTLTLPAVFGGSFSVAVTDDCGVQVAGTCRVLDRAGIDHTDRFHSFGSPRDRTGEVGELMPEYHNTFLRVLPPGDYELRCDFGPRGTHREPFRVRPREWTHVRIRLP